MPLCGILSVSFGVFAALGSLRVRQRQLFERPSSFTLRRFGPLVFEGLNPGRPVGSPREDARALRLLERQSDLDRGEAAGLRASRTRYLLQALGNYLRCLRGSSTHDLRLFRLASLWVGNASLPDVNALLQVGASSEPLCCHFGTAPDTWMPTAPVGDSFQALYRPLKLPNHLM